MAAPGSWTDVTKDPVPVDGHDVLTCQMPGGRQLVARWQPELLACVVLDNTTVLPTHWQELPDPPPVAAAPKAEARHAEPKHAEPKHHEGD